MKNLIFLAASLFLSQTQTNAQPWTELGGAGAIAVPGLINSICSDPAGNIYAAGELSDSLGHYYVAKWNGSSWSELGGLNGLSANSYIYAICTDVSGNIYAAGGFTNGASDTLGKCYVAKWDGSSWSELGGLNGLSANSFINSICSDAAGNIYAAGGFTNGANHTLGNRYVAKYNGSSWSELGGLNGLSANSYIYAICTDVSGNIYAAGNFTNGASDTSGKRYVAKYNGTAWSELGGLNGLAAISTINTICSDPSGNIYAAGNFTDSLYSVYIGKYNGSAWSKLGGEVPFTTIGVAGPIFALCSDTDGKIYAAGRFTNQSTFNFVAQWDGTSWNNMGDSTGIYMNGDLKALCTDPAGNIYVSGDLSDSLHSAEVFKHGPSSPATSISGPAPAPSVVISPNPAGSYFTISSGQNLSGASIRLLDLTGQVLMEQTDLSGQKFMLDISGRSPGLYFVELCQSGNTWTGKLVKE